MSLLQAGLSRRSPVDFFVAAVAEDLGVGAAAVEPEHDAGAGPGSFLQLGQCQREGSGQAGWLAGQEGDGAAVVRGDVGVGAAFLRPAALLVPAHGDRLGPGAGTKWSST